MIYGPWPDKLLAILREPSNLGAGLTVKQVASRLQCSTSQAARFLSSRVTQGLVRRERGAYGYHYYAMDDCAICAALEESIALDDMLVQEERQRDDERYR